VLRPAAIERSQQEALLRIGIAEERSPTRALMKSGKCNRPPLNAQD